MKTILTDKQFDKLETIILVSLVAIAIVSGCLQLQNSSTTSPSPKMTSTPALSPETATLAQARSAGIIEENPAGAVYELITPEPLCAAVTKTKPCTYEPDQARKPSTSNTCTMG